MNIDRNIQWFMNESDGENGRGPKDRYASFDYCYNYFQSFKENDAIPELSNSKNIEMSCLQLSFFLASWGMYRGSTHTIRRSSKFYEDLIKNLSKINQDIWEIEIEDYNNDKKLEEIFNCKKLIQESFGNWSDASDKLISKIMLGIFGVIPAFDTNFTDGCHANSITCNGISQRSLKALYRFYSEPDNLQKINQWSYRIHTLDFLTGEETRRNYPKAKILDMIFFTEGAKINEA